MYRVVATATALPPHRITQREAREACRRAFNGDRRLRALLDVFDRTGVEARHFAFPTEYYLEGHSYARRNRDYVAEAVKLGTRASREAIERAGLIPRDIDRFWFVTTTGIATPSVDVRVALELGLRPDCERNPLWGIGCAGGAGALARAARSSDGEGRALILSVELCGQNFLLHDRSPAHLIGTALFGDGAAAAVLSSERRGPAITGSEAQLFDGTLDVMGWDVTDDGLRLVLSPDVPKVVVERVVPALRGFLGRRGLGPSDIRHFILHPGGPRVLEAFESTLGADVRWSRDSLRRVGNLSSAAVLFVLHDLLESGEPKAGDRGLVAAVGPGFAVEAVLLEW